MQLPEEIISDEEVELVHANANFGSMSKRDVLADGVKKVAVGYGCGYTQIQILYEHGLITKPRGYETSLTKKGKRYARAVLNQTPDYKTIAKELYHALVWVETHGAYSHPSNVVNVAKEATEKVKW